MSSTIFARFQFAILVISLISSTQISSAQVFIATGARDGLYNQVGQALAERLGELGICDAVTVATAGTEENISLLLAGAADLALVQNDVFYAFNGENSGAQQSSPTQISNLWAISALFHENIQILVRQDEPATTFDQLLSDQFRVVLGAEGSGTRRNALEMLDALNISSDDYRDMSDLFDGRDVIQALIDTHVDAVFLTSGELAVDNPVYRGGVKMLPLAERDQRAIRRSYPHYMFRKIDTHTSAPVTVAYTRAVLVAGPRALDSGLSNDHMRAILEMVTSDEFEQFANRRTRLPITMFHDNLANQGINIPLHPEAERFFRSRGITPNLAFLAILLLGTMVAFVFATLAFHGFRLRSIFTMGPRTFLRMVRGAINTDEDWHRFIPYIQGFLLWIAFLIGGLFYVLWVEDRHAMAELQPNPFSNRTMSELGLWLVTFAGSGYTEGLFPESFEGKLMVAVLPLTSLFFIVFVFSQMAKQQQQRKDRQARGLSVPALSGHVIICGWNRRMANLIEQINTAAPAAERRKVIIVAMHQLDRPLDRYRFPDGSVYYLRGMSSDHEMLRKASITSAHSVLIVADEEKVKERNIRSLLTAFSVRTILNESKDNGRLHHQSTGALPQPAVIAEVFYDQNLTYFLKSGVHKIVPARRVTSRILLHALLNPGATAVMYQLLCRAGRSAVHHRTMDDPILRKAGIVGFGFGDAVRRLRTHGVLLLALYRNHTKHDATELDFRENSPYVVCPSSDSDTVVRPTDSVLILCANGIGVQTGQFLSSNLKSSDDTRCFHPDDESLLVVGPMETASLIIEESRAIVRRVIHIDTGAVGENKTVNSTDGFTYLRLEELEESAVVALLRSNRESFTRVRRALVLCPLLNAERVSQRFKQDDSTALLSLLLQKAFNEVFPERPPLHLVSEAGWEMNLSHFRSVGVSQPIAADALIDLVLSRMVFHRGVVAEFLLKSLSYNEANYKARFVKYAVSEIPGLDVAGSSYDIALASLLNMQMQLVAISITMEGGRLILNPKPKSPDAKYIIADSDTLFLFVCPGKVAPSGLLIPPW